MYQCSDGSLQATSLLAHVSKCVSMLFEVKKLRYIKFG